MLSMVRSTYTQGGLGNALKSGLNSVKATFQATKEVLTGEGISMRTAQAMTGLSENYLSELPGFVKPRRDTHAGNRLAAYTGVDNAVTQVRSVEAALKAQYKAMANKARQGLKTLTAGDSMGKGYNRLAREFTDAGTAALTAYNPYLGAAAYLNRGKLTKFFAKNPDAMSAVALGMGGGYVASVPFMAFESRRGFHEGGYTGSVTRPANHLLRNVRVGVGLLTGGAVDIDLGVKYNRRDGYSGRVGVNVGLAGGPGIGINYRSGSKEGASYTAGLHFAPVAGIDANLGYSYSRQAGAGVNAGVSFGLSKTASANLGISYSRKGGLGFNGGVTQGSMLRENPLDLGLNFNVSENGAWGVGASASRRATGDLSNVMKSAGLGINFSGGPGGRGFGVSALLNGRAAIDVDRHGKFTANHQALNDAVGDAGKLLGAKRRAETDATLNEATRAFLNGSGIEEPTTALRDKYRATNPDYFDENGELTPEGFAKIGKELMDTNHDARVARAAREGRTSELNDRSRDVTSFLGQLGLLTDQILGQFNGELVGEHGYIDKNGKFHQSTCFVKGTLVRTAAGFKEIQDIRPGDEVLAWNDKSGELTISRVQQTFVRTTDAIYKVTYEDGTVIETTWSHPFYVAGQGWVKGKDLRAGMHSPTATAIAMHNERVAMSGGYRLPVQTVAFHDVARANNVSVATVSLGADLPGAVGIASVEVVPRTETVYNFAVDEEHNYFVSTGSVLVHNQNPASYGRSNFAGQTAFMKLPYTTATVDGGLHLGERVYSLFTGDGFDSHAENLLEAIAAGEVPLGQRVEITLADGRSKILKEAGSAGITLTGPDIQAPIKLQGTEDFKYLMEGAEEANWPWIGTGDIDNASSMRDFLNRNLQALGSKYADGATNATARFQYESGQFGASIEPQIIGSPEFLDLQARWLTYQKANQGAHFDDPDFVATLPENIQDKILPGGNRGLPWLKGAECYGTATLAYYKTLGLVRPDMSRQDFESAFHLLDDTPVSKAFRGYGAFTAWTAANFANQNLTSGDWATLTGANRFTYLPEVIQSPDVVRTGLQSGQTFLRPDQSTAGHMVLQTGKNRLYDPLLGGRIQQLPVVENEYWRLNRTPK